MADNKEKVGQQLLKILGMKKENYHKSNVREAVNLDTGPHGEDWLGPFFSWSFGEPLTSP